MKIFESEVSTGNASGKAGVPSIPFGRGFYQSGNNGAFGTAFTPSGEPSATTYKSMKHSKKNLKKKMKHLKTFEMWTTSVTGNVNVNYGDKKPELSDIVMDAIKFIKDNYDQIKCGSAGSTESRVDFKDGLELEEIAIGVDARNKDVIIPYLLFYYRDVDNQRSNYKQDITDYDYEYLKDYFYKIYKRCRKEDQNKDKEQYKLELKKIEDKKMQKNAEKYNL